MVLLPFDVLTIQFALPELFGQAVDLAFEPLQLRFIGETDDIADVLVAV